MSRRAIPLGLCWALLATAQDQTVAAGARAAVSSETLPVYAAMSESGPPRVTLKRGDRVTIGMVLFGSDITWCAISRAGETKRLGYASCEFLEPEGKAPTPAAPPTPAPSTPAPANVAPPPPKPAPKRAPVTIREVPQAPIVVHELTPAPIALNPAPIAPPPASVAPPPVRAAPVPDSTKAPADFVETVLEGLSLRAEIATYTQSTRLTSFLDKGRLAEIDAAALDRVLAAQFRPEVILTAIGAQMRKSYSARRAAGVVEWVRSPAARKFAELERRADSPVSRQALVEFAGTLSEKPPSQTRLQLIHRIYNAARTGDMEVETTIALVYAAAQAIDPALPTEKRYSSNELDRALGPVKSRYRSVMKNARIVQSLFAYQSASDAELEQYAAFLESDGGAWLIAAIDKGFFDATESISQRLREQIPRHVKARPQ